MKQSRAMSLIESGANVAVGFGVAILTQATVFPLFGFEAEMRQQLAIASIFTGVSLVRSFALRRMFEGLRGAQRPR
ncbi:MAG: hypothetical protein Q4P24_07335 [Rhodobacterales bacterium]|nr:hypothetical protein [Rhodobacterales bacterium]